MAFSLLLGTSFVPLRAEAGLFSVFSIFNTEEASAQTDVLNPESGENSQNMTLLEANLSSALILGDETDEEIDENTNILSDNALLPATGPLGVSDGTEVAIRGAFSDQVSVYVVRKGDSISQIAEMFDVSVSTVLAANDLKKGDTIVEGEVLVILPISGIEHTVTKGQTLASIAKTYKVEISDITSYNGISEDAKLAIGDELLIPGGEMTEEGGEPSVNLGTSVVNDQNYYATHPIQGLASYFINPLPTGRKTQGLHGPGHRGIDIGAPSGTPIYAAASGIVLIAKTGWSGGYGNMTIIQHPNGTKTLYAHMSKLGTTTGASVSQGQVIGYVGSTGKSTGPHLHFEVFNAKNPGADWSWKN